LILINGLVDAKKFIENQLKIVKERLRNSEEAVKNFREENKLISLSAQTSDMLGKMAGLQADYEKAITDSQKIAEVNRLLERAKGKPLTSETSFISMRRLVSIRNSTTGLSSLC